MSRHEPVVTIDLAKVAGGLGDLLVMATDLDGVTVNADPEPGARRVQSAQASRDLLNLADTLDLLAGLVRQEYWAIKDYARITE